VVLDVWHPFSRDTLLAVLSDRKQRCEECGEYFTDWVDEKGNRLIGNRGPKQVVRTVRPCACAAIELDRNREDEGERPAGERVVLQTASPAPG
jgi:hypothetical protein